MKLAIIRYSYRDTSTSGVLLLDGRFLCFTLELPRTFEGKTNVPDKTCIPTGAFKGKVMPSPKHPDGAPHILNVPGRSAIEIHVANYPKDIKGCSAIGMTAAPWIDFVGDSAVAFGKLMNGLVGAGEFDVVVGELTQ